MNTIKKDILNIICKKYSERTSAEKFACQKGCSHCCTQNVMITAIEGELIFEFIKQENKEEWLAHCLASPRKVQNLQFTTNGFARLCLEKKEVEQAAANSKQGGVCPFLIEQNCSIYPVRPFSCRCFTSMKKCKMGGEAELPERLLVLNTITMQLIEHLGQKEYWGNILDVLTAMTDLPENIGIEKFIDDNSIVTPSRARLLKAEPLTGFLLMPEEEEMVSAYLQTIFMQKIGEKTVEQILNNR